MVEHGGDRRRSRSRARALVGTAALAVVLVGCSDEPAGTGGTAATGCPTPSSAPPAETALLPAGLSFDRIGTVTRVERAAGHIKAEAVTTKPLDEVTVLIQDAVTAAGYRPAGMDNEGDEAEVFFQLGSTAAGQAEVRRGECAGQWDIELDLLEPTATPTPSSTTT